MLRVIVKITSYILTNPVTFIRMAPLSCRKRLNNSVTQPHRQWLIISSNCKLQIPAPPAKLIKSCQDLLLSWACCCGILTWNWYKTDLWGLCVLHLYYQGKEKYSQWGGCWYSGATVTSPCLIRSGWFRLGGYLKTEPWATFHQTPSAMAQWMHGSETGGNRGRGDRSKRD